MQIEVNENNEHQYLDLREIGCPMALLLTKRAIVALKPQQVLVLDVKDSVAKKDISNYLDSQGFRVMTQEFENMARIFTNQ